MFDFGSDNIKKFTSEECMAAFMQRVTDEPALIRNFIQLHTADMVTHFEQVLWPAVHDTAAWTRTATRRPAKTKEDGGFGGGTDLTIRTYENDVWEENGHWLEAHVTTEHNEITDIQFEVRW